MRWRPDLIAGVLVLAGTLALPAVAVASTPTVSESFSAASIPLTGTATLTFAISNSDPPTSPHAVNFDDKLPAGLQVVGTPTTTCATGVLSPGGSSDIVFTDAALIDNPGCTVSASVQGTQAGHWDNAVSVSVDLNPTNADAALDVVAPPSISATFGTSLLGLDGTTSLTFTLTNPNPTFALTSVGFTDTMPAGLVIAGAPGPGDSCGGTVTAAAGSDSVGLSGGQLSPGSSCSVSATVAATATGAVSTTTTQVTSTEGAVGNTASASLTVIGAPTATLSSPLGGHAYTFGQQVRASYSCADDPNGPGIASCDGDVPDGAPIDTSKAGPHTFTVTATSKDGGVATDIAFYTVGPDNRFKLTKRKVHPDGSIAFTVKLPGPGRLEVLETVSGSKLVFGRGAATARRAGSARLTVKPSARGRLALRARHALRVIVIVGYTPKGGTRRTARLQLKVA